jgi:hypothetical protein
MFSCRGFRPVWAGRATAFELGRRQVSGLYFVYLSIKMIRNRAVATDAGFRTSLDLYRSHYEWERRMISRIWGAVEILMFLAAITAIDRWMEMARFPTADATQVGLAYLLFWAVAFVIIRQHHRTIDRALHMVDGLENDERIDTD